MAWPPRRGSFAFEVAIYPRRGGKGALLASVPFTTEEAGAPDTISELSIVL